MNYLIKAKLLSNSGTPLVNQKIFLHYFFSERLQQHMEKLRIALGVRKDIVEQELSATDWQWNSPAGGFNLWVKLPETVEIERLLPTCIKQSPLCPERFAIRSRSTNHGYASATPI